MTTGAGRKEPSLAPAVAPAELKIGAILDGKWRLDEEIGKGTFAKVYRVFNLDHQRTYAMKILVDAENADLALHEFNQVQPHLPNTQHRPNRVDGSDRSAAGIPYIVSEFVKGETLEPYCADGAPACLVRYQANRCRVARCAGGAPRAGHLSPGHQAGEHHA
jgi:hypothetical protein